MGMSNAEKQAAWRARQATNKTRVAELEAEVERLKALADEAGSAVVKTSRQVLTRQHHRLILSCLHPDRVIDPAQKEIYTRAFRAFDVCFDKRDLREPRVPRATDMPRDAGDRARRRAEETARRKRKKAG